MSQRIEVRDNKSHDLIIWGGTFLREEKHLAAKIKYGIQGNLSQDDFIKRVGSYTQEMLRDKVAVFPYPRTGNIQELSVFEAFLSNGPMIRRAKEALKKNPSVERYKKAIEYFKVALAIQKYKGGEIADLERAILAIKKDFFLFQAEEYASKFLPPEDIESFLKIIKDKEEVDNLFEVFLDLSKSSEESQSFDLLSSSPKPYTYDYFSPLKIAESLWLDPEAEAIMDEDIIQKVNTAAIYLYERGFELKGVSADGDCFCNAFLKSYGTLSRKIRILDGQENKISYLRGVIAAKYLLTQEDKAGGGKKRAYQIKQDKEQLITSEGGLLATALSIPIRMVTINKDKNGCGINDMLIPPEAGQAYELWDGIQEKEKPKEHILIVDLGSHFIYAESCTPRESGKTSGSILKNKDKHPKYNLPSLLLKAMSH